MIAEGGRRRANLRRKALVEGARDLTKHTAAARQPLQCEGHGDHSEVATEQVERRQRDHEQRGNNHRPAPANAVRKPAAGGARHEREQVGDGDRRRDHRRAHVQIALQVRGEQRIDRIVGYEGGCHEPARAQRVAEDAPLEEGKERRTHLALLSSLEAPILDPDRGFLDVDANVDDREGRQDAEPQHAAPADIVVEQAVDDARQQEAEIARGLQNAAHQAARAHRPGFHDKCCSDRPFRPHADAQQGPEQQQKPQGRRKTGDEVAERIPGDRDHQRRLAPDPIGEPTRPDGADQTHPQGDRQDEGDGSERHVEFLGDRHHDQQEHSEIEGVQGPAEPSGPPGVPLVLGRLFPPRDGTYGFTIDSRHCRAPLIRLSRRALWLR